MKTLVMIAVVASVIASGVFFGLIKPYLDGIMRELEQESIERQTTLREPLRGLEWRYDSEATTVGEVLQHGYGVDHYQQGIRAQYIDNYCTVCYY